MPLLEGIVNFYPGFACGVRICGLCALAVRFLPIAVMRTGAQNRLWFLHTQSLPMAVAIARTDGKALYLGYRPTVLGNEDEVLKALAEEPPPKDCIEVTGTPSQALEIAAEQVAPVFECHKL
ncbi:MAG: CRISPR-associated protein Cst1 [Bacillota bacterium]|nr:CRISPR-associated protein Cst1 [Bacillota bacterium]